MLEYDEFFYFLKYRFSLLFVNNFCLNIVFDEMLIASRVVLEFGIKFF